MRKALQRIFLGFGLFALLWESDSDSGDSGDSDSSGSSSSSSGDDSNWAEFSGNSSAQGSLEGSSSSSDPRHNDAMASAYISDSSISTGDPTTGNAAHPRRKRQDVSSTSDINHHDLHDIPDSSDGGSDDGGGDSGGDSGGGDSSD